MNAVTRAIREKVCIRDHEHCVVCDTRTRQIHHKNGNTADNRMRNLQTLCQPCHIRHHHTGSKRSQETRTKMRIAATGKVHSQATVIKLRIAALGRKCSAATIEKMHAVHTGHRHSPETIERLSTARKRNWQDPEYRANRPSHYRRRPCNQRA